MTTINRRSLLSGLAAAPLAVVLADPMRAAAAAAQLETVTLKTPGGREVKAALAPLPAAPAGAVLLIHEWWGLNDQIKAVAAELANEGFVALAVDLYDGKATADPAVAQGLVKEVDPAAATDTLVAWIDWLRRSSRVSGKIATIGWCFGGGWSLNASLAVPVEATVIYYGQVTKTAAELGPLKGPVLGHFAEQDQWITKDMVAGFEQAMRQAGKSLEAYSYSADHGFANPTSARYDTEDAQAAWARTLEFLQRHLG